MTGIRPLWHAWLRFYLSWALSEIDPLHEDVPRIVHRLNDLRTAA